MESGTPLGKIIGSPIGVAGRALSFFMGLPTTTVEGRFFLAGLVALGFLATATDRNYVLLTLGVLISVVVVSVVFSGLNLRGIEFRRSLPDAVIAGEPFSVRVRITNQRRWFPARNVLLKDALQSALTGQESRCYAPLIPAGGHVTFVYAARIRRRGAYNITNALLSTRFPFRLFVKRTLARHPSRIVVYPRTREVAGDRLPGSRDLHLALAERSMRRPGGDEFRSLRDYRAGDDPRRIAWRISARQQKLVLKEMERENRGRVAVVLATSLDGLPPNRRRVALERAVTLTASLVRYFHRERRAFLFSAPGLTTEVFNRLESMHACLEHLATIRADSRCGPKAVLSATLARRLSGRDVILVSPTAKVEMESNGHGYRLHFVDVLQPGAERLLRRGFA